MVNTPKTVTVQIGLDLSAWNAAMADLAQRTARIMGRFGAALEASGYDLDDLLEQLEQPEHVDGEPILWCDYFRGQGSCNMGCREEPACTVDGPWRFDDVPAAVMAGFEVREYVKGGFDSRYATPAARDEHIRYLTRWGSRWNSGGAPNLAAAFLHGWVEHRPADLECLCWPTPILMHYVYYGATEPGSAWEHNPACGVHP